jgi:hypothetical protein
MKIFLCLLALLLGATPSSATTQVFNVLDYLAVADNSSDNSTPFANAIAAASSAGGGIVFVPDAHGSCYKFGSSGVLLLPSNVHLVGISNEKSFIGAQGAVNGTPVGSALCITNSTVPFITLGQNAGLDVSSVGVIGITFFYPNQTPGNPPGISYPATIREQNNGVLLDFIISDCVFLNSFDGIALPTIPKARGVIRNINGQFLHSAINIDNMQDWMTINNIFDSEQMWSINSSIIPYQQASAISLILGAVPINVTHYTATGKYAFAQLNTGAGGLAPQGHFKDLNMDDCTNGLVINNTGYAGITIDGINLTCTQRGQGIYMLGGNVTIAKLGAWGTFNNTIDHLGGSLFLSQALLQTSSSGYGIYNGGGDAMFNQIKFDANFSAAQAAFSIVGGTDYFVSQMDVIPTGASGTVRIATPGAGISNIIFTDNICRGPTSIPHSGSGVAFANNTGSC